MCVRERRRTRDLQDDRRDGCLRAAVFAREAAPMWGWTCAVKHVPRYVRHYAAVAAAIFALSLSSRFAARSLAACPTFHRGVHSPKLSSA